MFKYVAQCLDLISFILYLIIIMHFVCLASCLSLHIIKGNKFYIFSKLYQIIYIYVYIYSGIYIIISFISFISI